MKKIISLLLVISMMASLAVIGMAKSGIFVTGGAYGTDYNEPTTGTLNVLKDFTCEKIYSMDTDLIINLNGHTLTVSSTNDNLITTDGSDLIINGSGKLKTVTTQRGSILSQKNIYINNATIESTLDGTFELICANNGNGNVYAENSSITLTAVNAGGNRGMNANTRGIYGKAVVLTNTNVNININGSQAEGISGKNGIAITGGTYKVELNESSGFGIFSSNGIDINNANITVTVSGTNSKGIYADNGNSGKINISSGTINVTANGSGSDGIYADNDLNITGGSITAKADNAILADNDLNISTGVSIMAKGTSNALVSDGTDIFVDGITIDELNYMNYFYGKNEQAVTYESGSIKSTDWVCFGVVSEQEDDSADESDPDVEIDFGYGPVTVKTSNKSLVLNDKKIVEKEVLESNNLFVPFDLSNTPVKLDGIFLNNDVYKYISEAGKGIELKNRFAYADVFKKDDVGLNPLSLHLSDVSEIPGTCATAIQKAAMQTSKVYAQVNYSFVSNGKPTENEAKIYVPVPAEAKVFYLFNESKIGTVPCEYINGYCVFNRYFDGTYVVVAK